MASYAKDDALDDFEKQLAADKLAREKEEAKSKERSSHRSHHRSSRHRSRSRSREHRHRSSRHDDDRKRDRDDDRDRDRHRSKRRHHDEDDRDEERRWRHRRETSKERAERKSREHRHGDDKPGKHGEMHRLNEKTSDPKMDMPIPNEEETNASAIKPPAARDSWMTEPSANDFDYTQRGARKEEVKTGGVREVLDLRIHKNELNSHLADLHNDGPADQAARKVMEREQLDENNAQEEEQMKEVDYEFGDAGAQWRMTKLKAAYREADESERPIEEVATERLGGLKEFDDANEEETELERRRLYGSGYVGKIKPSGELYEERKRAEGIKKQQQQKEADERMEDPPQGQIVEDQAPSVPAMQIDQSQLNKMKAALLKAQLRKAPHAAQLQKEYDEARAAFDAQANNADNVVVLNEMTTRLLAGTRGEVVPITNKRGLERGLVKENEDMTIEDMVREERRTRGVPGGEGRKFAEQIAKDGKFKNDLDYIDDNAEKLSKAKPKSAGNLKNMAISEFQRMERVLNECQLCHHEERNQPPVAPVLALGTRVYLTLPTAPEISEGGAVIVPIAHHTNLLECDDDEWEEVRNFQKALTALYTSQGRDVIFYENAAFPNRRGHAAMIAVPLPYEVGELSPAFFKEAIVSRDFMEKSQHKKLYDTGKLAREAVVGAKGTFRRTLAKEMPYFHVWFDLNGGLGHVVESEENWPTGDLFAREVIGGMLDVEPDVVRRQGRWHRVVDPRAEEFKKRFRKWDWTRVLTDAQ